MNTRKQQQLLRQGMLKEHRQEDMYFTARDRELLRRLHDAVEDEHRESVRELARARCPECGTHLERHAYRDVAVEACPVGHGLWMTEAEMRTLARRESSSWIGRYFYRPTPVV